MRNIGELENKVNRRKSAISGENLTVDMGRKVSPATLTLLRIMFSQKQPERMLLGNGMSVGGNSLVPIEVDRYISEITGYKGNGETNLDGGVEWNKVSDFQVERVRPMLGETTVELPDLTKINWKIIDRVENLTKARSQRAGVAETRKERNQINDQKIQVDEAEVGRMLSFPSRSFKVQNILDGGPGALRLGVVTVTPILARIAEANMLSQGQATYADNGLNDESETRFGRANKARKTEAQEEVKTDWTRWAEEKIRQQEEKDNLSLGGVTDPLLVQIDINQLINSGVSRGVALAIESNFNLGYRELVRMAVPTLFNETMAYLLEEAIEGRQIDARLKRTFSQTAVRSLTSGMTLLKQISRNADSYYSNLVKLCAANAEAGKVILTPSELAFIGRAVGAFYHGVDNNGKIKSPNRGFLNLLSF